MFDSFKHFLKSPSIAVGESKKWALRPVLKGRFGQPVTEASDKIVADGQLDEIVFSLLRQRLD